MSLAKDLMSFLAEHDVNTSDFIAHYNRRDDDEERDELWLELENKFGKPVLIKSGRKYNDPNTMQLIFKTSTNEELFQAQGYYSSWDSTDWSDTELTEVTVKTITVHD